MIGIFITPLILRIGVTTYRNAIIIHFIFINIILGEAI